MTRGRMLLAGLLVAGLLLSACTTAVPGTPTGLNPSDPTLAAGVGALPQRGVGTAPVVRLAPGLVPPTNRWFSGLVFNGEPQPVFPLPLSVGVRDDGFAIGLPNVTATEKTIFGAHTPAVDLGLGTARTQVVAYDELTVTSAFLDAGGTERGRMLMARGWPYVRYTASAAQQVTLAPWPGPDGVVEIRGARYGIAVGGGAEVAGAGVRLPDGGSVTMYAVPPGGDAGLLAERAGAPVLGGSVAHRIDGDHVVASLAYRVDGGDPLVAAMPHQDVGAGDGECAAGTYRTVYGPMTLCAAATLEVAAPVLEPAGELDLSGLAGADRAAVGAAVREDAAGLEFTAGDTYFGGKQLARAANLMRLAEQLELTDVAADIRGLLAAELRGWTKPGGCLQRPTRCFVYDPALRGVVGLENSFGSELFNDHQFHYGYFLYAAAVTARDDPALAADIGPVIDLLAADIGAGAASAEFPQHRAFDAYEGHSWASGFSPFADGNNQESSSESVTAYNGLALWARVRGDDQRAGDAVALLSREAATAALYWTEPPLDSAEFDGFGRGILSINWGGKRDYATWFSAEPSAMLGIQLIPMSPVAGYLAGDPERIRANVGEAAPNGFDVMFGDYLLMYLAMADPAAARAAVATLPAERIDDGNSRAYLLAWVYTR